MKTYKEAIDILGRRSAVRKYHDGMSGAMLPRGLDLTTVGMVLDVVYQQKWKGESGTPQELWEKQKHYEKIGVKR